MGGRDECLFEISKASMPPKMGLRMSSYFHNAFYAFDCQGLSGIAGRNDRLWPTPACPTASYLRGYTHLCW